MVRETKLLRGHMKEKSCQIPPNPKDAEEFLAGLTFEVHHRLNITDSVEPAVRVSVGKRGLSFRQRVLVAGKWTWFTFGRAGVISIQEVRLQAATIRDHGSRFNSRTDLLHLVSGKALQVSDSCPTVLEAFELVFEDRVRRRVVKSNSVKSYRSALKAAGAEFYDVTINLITTAQLKRVARKIGKGYSRQTFDHFKNACWWAWDYCEEHGIGGIQDNLAGCLKGLKVDRNENAPTGRERPSLVIEWEAISAMWAWLCDLRCPLTETQKRLYRCMYLLGERIEGLCLARWEDIGEDDWWVILPENRKTQLRYLSSSEPLFIKVTEVLRMAIGYPDGRSAFIFPSETDPSRPYPHGSLPIWNLFRARVAIKAGARHADHAGQPVKGKSVLTGSTSKSTIKRERNYLKHYEDFLIPDIVPAHSHHDARHSVATHAQEAGIPGFYVSKMLGHSSDKKLPGKPIVEHSSFQNLPVLTLNDMPRALRRKAEAATGTAKTTREFYTHIKDLPGTEVAWYLWTKLFCENVLGYVPESIKAAVDSFKGSDDQILDILIERFGSLDDALQHICSGSITPGSEHPGRSM